MVGMSFFVSGESTSAFSLLKPRFLLVDFADLDTTFEAITGLFLTTCEVEEILQVDWSSWDGSSSLEKTQHVFEHCKYDEITSKQALNNKIDFGFNYSHLVSRDEYIFK